MVDEKTPIEPPEIREESEIVRFNVLLAHLFAVLSTSQSMSLLHVNPCKHNTVQDIVTCIFPAIKSTDNKPTPAITSKTIGYIHALVMDTLTFNSTEAPYARALQNQAMICAELDKLTPAAFQTELRDCLVDYYEKVCLMVGAGGALSTKPHKRKFKPPATTSEEGVEEAAGAGAGGDEEAAGDGGIGDIEATLTSTSPASERARTTPAPAPGAEAPAAAAAPAEATPSPAKAAGKRGAGGKSAKTR
jgi:uncharacterized membrane protein